MKNKLRLLFQLVVVALLAYIAVRPFVDAGYVRDFEAYCPFGGISSILMKPHGGTMPCQMGAMQLVMGIGLLVGVILLGKLFCSYICPLGILSEWLGKLGAKFRVSLNMPALPDRLLRALKYVLLFITLYLTMSSSELFCKRFEPYFAITTGFSDHDLIRAYAIPATIIFVLGVVFFKAFWCRYLCPLGAASNIFLNVVGVAAVTVVFLIVNACGAELSLVWLMGGLVAMGLVTEVVFKRSVLLPVTRIKRNPATCTNCGLCEKACPQGIPIMQYEKVNHIDCNLCTDCVYSCPRPDALAVNGKSSLKYIAPIATIVLIVVCLVAARHVELTTLSERWGAFDKLKAPAAVTMQLKTMKCYGVAKALISQLQKRKGICGMDAYASSRRVKVYYDSDKLTEKDVKAAIFTPVRRRVRWVKGDPETLAVWNVGIENLFDKYDYIYLIHALLKCNGAYGFETEFGEPVMATIYYDPSITSPEKMREAIEVDEIELKSSKGTRKVELSFEVEGEGVDKGRIPVDKYKKRMFKTYNKRFNKYSSFDPSELSVLVYPMEEAKYPFAKKSITYLVAHISRDDGIVGFSTRYMDGYKACVYFDPKQTTVEKVQAAITNPVFIVTFKDESVREFDNPFKSKPEGYVTNAADIVRK